VEIRVDAAFPTATQSWRGSYGDRKGAGCCTQQLAHQILGVHAISAKRLACHQQEGAILKFIIQLTAGRYNTLGL
jgi:hypothetical protein